MKRSVLIVVIIVCLLVGAGAGYAIGYLRYEPKIKEYQIQISDLKSEAYDLSITISSQAAQISSQAAQISEQEVQISTLESEKTSLETELNRANTQIQNYKEEVNALESDKSRLQDNLDRTKIRMDQYREQATTVQSQLSNTREQLDNILGVNVQQYYQWEHKWETWEWTLDIPLSIYAEYLERPRPESLSGWVDMAKDDEDDYYIDQMVQQINTAALEKSFTEGEKLNFVVAFVQNLPYTADNVTTPYDEYPRYPIETLFDRGGDCEDTSILVAALLDRLGYDVALLFLEDAQHVAVGVYLTNTYGAYYEYDEKKYYYLETTVPGWEIGVIPPSYSDTEAHIYPL